MSRFALLALIERRPGFFEVVCPALAEGFVGEGADTFFAHLLLRVPHSEFLLLKGGLKFSLLSL
jgi:hypothetical protein